MLVNLRQPAQEASEPVLERALADHQEICSGRDPVSDGGLAIVDSLLACRSIANFGVGDDEMKRNGGF